METNKDLYGILEIDKSCSYDEVKKAYRKLALRYHPDKCHSPEAQEKFIDIQNSYQILSDPIKRKQYDTLDLSEKMEFYDTLKEHILSKIPNIDYYIKAFFQDEEKLKKYIDSMNLCSIYNHIIEKFTDVQFIFQDPNIYGTLTATFEDKFHGRFKKIAVNRQTKEPTFFFIPLTENKFILEKEGEYINGKHGDIIIDVTVIDDDKYRDFVQVKNDIYYTRYISLYEYLYGGEFTFGYLDGEEHHILFDSFIEKFPLITVEKKGMPFGDSRGSLFIVIKIKDLNTISTSIKNLCSG